MSTLADRLSLLATRAGAESKSLRTLLNGNTSDLSTLTTTDKTNLVAALNELKTLVEAASGNVAALIDDSAATATNKTYSINKIKELILAAKNELLGDAPAAALDTLKELGDALTAEGSAVAAITTALAKRVAVDQEQTFTAAEQLQGCTNLGIGDPDADLVAAFEAALA